MDHRHVADAAVLLLAAGLAVVFAVAGHLLAALCITVLGAALAGSMAERWQRRR